VVFIYRLSDAPIIGCQVPLFRLSGVFSDCQVPFFRLSGVFFELSGHSYTYYLGFFHQGDS